MFKVSIGDLKNMLKQYVPKDYYILWVLEEAMYRGSRYLEFFYNVNPIVSLILEVNIVFREEVNVQGVKVIVNRKNAKKHGVQWDKVLTELRNNLLKMSVLYRESEDQVYAMIDVKDNTQMNNVVKEVMRKLRSLGFKIPKEIKIIGYDYME